MSIKLSNRLNKIYRKNKFKFLIQYCRIKIKYNKIFNNNNN